MHSHKTRRTRRLCTYATPVSVFAPVTVSVLVSPVVVSDPLPVTLPAPVTLPFPFTATAGHEMVVSAVGGVTAVRWWHAARRWRVPWWQAPWHVGVI